MEMDNTMTEHEMWEWNEQLLKNTCTIEDYMYLMEHTHIFHYDIGIIIKMTDKSYLFEYGHSYRDIQYKRVDKKDSYKVGQMLHLLRKELTHTLDDRLKKMYSKDEYNIHECWHQIIE
jgi:hypothetical protein